LSEHEVVGKRGIRWIHPKDHPKVLENLKRRSAGDTGIDRYEVTMVNGSDGELEVEISSAMIRNSNQETPEILVIARDVSSRREAERLLRDSEERLRKILSEMPVMLVARNKAGIIVEWNMECERVTGWSAGEIVGNPDADELIYPDQKYFNRMMDELEAREGDYRNWAWETMTKDGEVCLISWSNLSRYVVVPGWETWGIGVDITQQRRAEERLREHEKITVAQQLAGTIAHEFRQPLATLQLAVDLSSQLDTSEEKRNKMSELIKNAVERIDGLVAKLLQITEVKSRRYALGMEILELTSNSEKESRSS
jgi:PAS domain S-box-containing protein